MRHRYIIPIAAALLMPLEMQAAPVVFTGAGEDTAALTPTVDDFRNALGPNNGNAPINAGPDGHRSINWDAAPDGISDPNGFPGDFFNANFAPRARGIEFKETGNTTGFLLSSTQASGQPPAFGFESDFPTFSPERLFSPVGGTTFDVAFFDPASPSNQATSRGLGVVFSGLDRDDTAGMRFYDQDGGLLAEEFAPSGDGDLSFLGVLFEDPIVASVKFFGGTRFLSSNRDFDGPVGDAFVMDDFIFGEPIPLGQDIAPIPLPAPAVLLSFALCALGVLRRRQAKRV